MYLHGLGVLREEYYSRHWQRLRPGGVGAQVKKSQAAKEKNAGGDAGPPDE
jgi:hypothetical protein